jgi:hypothetical protein
VYDEGDKEAREKGNGKISKRKKRKKENKKERHKKTIYLC